MLEVFVTISMPDVQLSKTSTPSSWKVTGNIKEVGGFRCPILPIKQIDISFTSVRPVIDHEFHHYVAKVAVDPPGNSQVDLQTTLTML